MSITLCNGHSKSLQLSSSFHRLFDNKVYQSLMTFQGSDYICGFSNGTPYITKDNSLTEINNSVKITSQDTVQLPNKSSWKKSIMLLFKSFFFKV